MRRLSLFFFLLMTTGLIADLQWHTITPLSDNIRFQMPGIPEEQSQEKIHSWKVEAAGNTYWVIVKPRQCSTTTDRIKICDFMPILIHVIPDGWTHFSSNKESKNPIHVSVTDGKNSYIHASLFYNKDIILGLMTKTNSPASPEHQNFIESFVFLE